MRIKKKNEEIKEETNEKKISYEIIDNMNDESIEEIRMIMIIIFVNSLKKYLNCNTTKELLIFKKNNMKYFKYSFVLVLSKMTPIIFDIVLDFLEGKKNKKE